MTLLGWRLGGEDAAAFGRAVYDAAEGASEFVLIRPEASDERAALDLVERHAGQDIGFVDCLSFVLMRTRGVKTVFTFDRDFRVGGFEVVP